MCMDFVGIDKFSLLDYEDKVAVVLFSKACNFRCPFCHNGQTVLEADTFIPFDDILAYLRQRKGLIDAVVVSGGEPTLMPDLVDKIKQIKELGYLVKLDTNGTNPELVRYLFQNKLIDYVAMDIKNSEKKYPLTAGAKNVYMDKIKETINFLINSPYEYEFRTTIIDEFHNEEDIKEIAQLIKGAKRMYLQKYVDRESCIAHGFHEVSEEKAKHFKDILSGTIHSVNLRGY